MRPLSHPPSSRRSPPIEGAPAPPAPLTIRIRGYSTSTPSTPYSGGSSYGCALLQDHGSSSSLLLAGLQPYMVQTADDSLCSCLLQILHPSLPLFSSPPELFFHLPSLPIRPYPLSSATLPFFHHVQPVSAVDGSEWALLCPAHWPLHQQRIRSLQIGREALLDQPGVCYFFFCFFFFFFVA